VKRETRNLISVDLYGPIYAENMKDAEKSIYSACGSVL
jgi:hypothetical protein